MMNKTVHIAFQILLILLFIGASDALPGGDSDLSREYRLKAGLIFNLTKFVDYPVESAESAHDCFRIGILGNDPFKEEIEILNGKIIQEKKIEVVRYKSIEEIGECRMLFISSSEIINRSQIIEALKSKKILTLSDMDGFSEAGGMIHFITVNNRIRFKVNLFRVREAGLKLSSHFLRLAIIVDPAKIQKDDSDPK